MKKILILMGLIGLVLAAAGLWYKFHSQDPPPIQYTTAPVRFGPAVETVSATGMLQPRQVYLVGSELSGKVVEVAADFLQVVEEGRLLLRLDDRADRARLDQADKGIQMAQAAVRQAEAARDTAKFALEREEGRPEAIRREIDLQVARNQFRTAEAGVDVARAKVEQSKEERRLAALRLEMTVIKAPSIRHVSPSASRVLGTVDVEGQIHDARTTFVVLDRKVSLNQMVGPPLSAHLFTLADDLGRLRVEALVAEGDVHKVKTGCSADLTVSASELGTFSGKVTELRPLPVSEQGAVFYKAVIEVVNSRDPDGDGWILRPGETATVDIVCRRHERAWCVPNAALSFQPDESQLTEAARARLTRTEGVGDRKLWKSLWIVGTDGHPWPILVRTGGKDTSGEIGIRDASFTEVLEWDPELSSAPQSGKPSTYPRVIISAPAVKKGLLDRPNLRI